MGTDRPSAGSAAMARLSALVQEAGAAAMRFYGDSSVAVAQKADRSPVTAADLAANAVIVSGLRDWDPAVPIVSEEAAVPSYAARAAWRRFWLVDPLDGTKEFLSGNGEFTVNVALIEDGVPILGAVSAPALQTTYVAAEGLGSWVRVRDQPQQRVLRRHPHASELPRIVESRSHPSEELEAFIAALGPVERIRMGSSLKICAVAEGRADLYPRFGPTMEWDVAAADCVYRNASEGPHDSPFTYNQPTLCTPRFVLGSIARVSTALLTAT